MFDVFVNRFKIIGLFLCACLVGILTWDGWGWWGFGADGDYALDMMDALRRFGGEIPYRDFIPIYGALHVHLIAPFFSFGKQALPVIWICTAGFIWIQSWMILRIAGTIHRGWWTIGAGVLFLTLCAFPSYGTKFLVGYCQSGFLASWLFTLLLVLLSGVPNQSASGQSYRCWFGVGVLLGAELFTKMDISVTCVIVAVVLILILLVNRLRREARVLIAGYASVCFGVWTFLYLQGGKPSLIIETALEGFAAAGVVRDYALQKHLILLGAVVLTGAIAMIVPFLRSRLLRLRPLASLALLLGLPLVFVWDAWRVSRYGSGCDMVGVNYFFCAVVFLVSSRYFVAIWRRRSIALFPHKGHLWKGIACLIGLAGIARAALTGWGVLNYYQPALFLVAILVWRRSWESLARSYAWGNIAKVPLLTIASLSMVLVIVGSFGKSWRTVRPSPELVSLDSRWGNILYSPSYHRDLLLELQEHGGDAYLFTNHLPGIYFYTGMRCASFYTWLPRVGMGGSYQNVREEQTRELFEKREPPFVVLTDEKYRQFHIPQFGKDYNKELLNQITNKYQVIKKFVSPENGEGSTVWKRIE
jgi:hypothetical protein